MCNPRRIRITATRLLSEAWQQEITRQVQLSARVTGEARVRQPLGVTLGGPTLAALEAAFAAEESGWVEVDEGYRFDLEGGHVTYLAQERMLEIVAITEDLVQVSGEARRTLEGVINDEIAAEGEDYYYDDEWAYLRTKEVGEQEAKQKAEQGLDEAARERMKQARQEAEQSASSDVETEAQRKAEAQLRREAAERQAALAVLARQRLETVGLRARQAFHQVLGRAMQDALLAYARQHGATDIQVQEDGGVVDIAFSFSG